MQASEREMETARLVTSGRKTKFDWEKMSRGDKREFAYKSDNQKQRTKQMNLVRYSATYFAKTRKVAISVFEGQIKGGKQGIIAVRFK